MNSGDSCIGRVVVRGVGLSDLNPRAASPNGGGDRIAGPAGHSTAVASRAKVRSILPIWRFGHPIIGYIGGNLAVDQSKVSVTIVPCSDGSNT